MLVIPEIFFFLFINRMVIRRANKITTIHDPTIAMIVPAEPGSSMIGDFGVGNRSST